MKEQQPHSEVIDLTDPSPEQTTEPISEPETASDTAPTSDTEPATAEELRRLVAEAEQRGYLRGLNERARQEMDRPALFENPNRRRRDPTPSDGESLASGFLSRLPRGVWD